MSRSLFTLLQERGREFLPRLHDRYVQIVLGDKCLGADLCHSRAKHLGAVAISADQYHAQARNECPEAGHSLQSIDHGQYNVHNRQVRLQSLDTGFGLGDTTSFTYDREPGIGQQFAELTSKSSLVIYNQDASHTAS